jgi:hypothetical protein
MAFIYSLTDTWADAGVTFTGIGLNVTDTASAAASNLLNLQIGGVSKFSVSKSTVNSTVISLGSNGGPATIEASGNGLTLAGNGGHNVVLPAAQFLRSGAGFGLMLGTGAQVNSPLLFGSTQEANHTIAQRNGTNAQAFRVYNTFTDASNYERGRFEWSTNVLRIGTEAAGTGSARPVEVFIGNTRQFRFEQDISISRGWFGLGVSGNTSNVYLYSGTATVCRLQSNVSGGSPTGATMELFEMTAPAAPAANGVRIYAEDDGSGKTRLMALFATGAAQQIAIEP